MSSVSVTVFDDGNKWVCLTEISLLKREEKNDTSHHDEVTYSRGSFRQERKNKTERNQIKICSRRACEEEEESDINASFSFSFFFFILDDRLHFPDFSSKLISKFECWQANSVPQFQNYLPLFFVYLSLSIVFSSNWYFLSIVININGNFF